MTSFVAMAPVLVAAAAGRDPASLPALAGVAVAGIAAGLINALAGGGSLISFPALTALGLPALIANATNSVALSPGYGGATLAQRPALVGQGRRLLLLLPAAALGGLLGGVLLLGSGERLFRSLVPWLILLGSLLLALQDPLRRCLLRQSHRHGRSVSELWSLPPVLLASIYGGYFGAGLSVIVLAVLAIALEDSLARLNGLKQAIALVANLSAALLFAGLGRVDWPVALVLGLGALAGGTLGGRLAGRLDPQRLRGVVVGLGVLIALVFWLRG